MRDIKNRANVELRKKQMQWCEKRGFFSTILGDRKPINFHPCNDRENKLN